VSTPDPAQTSGIARISLDEHTVKRRSPEIEHERAIAIYDLLEGNVFRLLDGHAGPYDVKLRIEDNRLIFDIRLIDGDSVDEIKLPLSNFRRIVRDYFMICESYYDAIKTKTLQQIEAIDMGRRGVHNEGAELLRERLADRVAVDEDTSRRLFTLICVLHIRG